MRITVLSLLATLGSLLLSANLRAEFRIVAYVPNWIDLEAFAKTIPYDQLTHINVAFENPTNEEGELSFHRGNEVLIAAAHAAKIPVLISIGGGSASGDPKLKARYFDLLSESKREGFARKLADYVSEHDFDGIDVDIEGPSINEDYGAFIETLAKCLKPAGKLLTAALSQGYGGKNVPDSVFEHFDFVNIMAYDGAGYWDPEAPGQHSSFDFAKSNVNYWLKRGLPRSKAVLGVPFYGRGFNQAFKKRDYPYKTILESYPDAARVDQVGETIWYNGIPTIEAKTRYAIVQGLGGIMIWSLDSDAPGENSLLSAIHAVVAENDSRKK
ncbi:MAG: glycosyl hydrolase family 18 protein [Chthoniobacteraceae bacterium]